MSHATRDVRVEKLRVLGALTFLIIALSLVFFQITYLKFREYTIQDCINYGHLLTVYTPLYDNQGSCACYVAVDFSMDELGSYVMGVVLNVTEAAAIFVLVIAVGGYLFAIRGIFRPMDHMFTKAYQDEITGIGNKAAYAERASNLDDSIAAGRTLGTVPPAAYTQLALPAAARPQARRCRSDRLRTCGNHAV